MKEKVDKILNGTFSNDELKYLMYSAHDTQMDNTLAILDPIDFKYLYTKFSS